MSKLLGVLAVAAVMFATIGASEASYGWGLDKWNNQFYYESYGRNVYSPFVGWAYSQGVYWYSGYYDPFGSYWF
jgi:cyclic lactone autoinducer peptide